MLHEMEKLPPRKAFMGLDSITSPYSCTTPRYKYLWKWQIVNCAVGEGDCQRVRATLRTTRSLKAKEKIPEVEYDIGTLGGCLKMCEYVTRKEQSEQPIVLFGLILSLLRESSDVMAATLADKLGVEYICFISQLLEFRNTLLKQWNNLWKELGTHDFRRQMGNDWKNVESLILAFNENVVDNSSHISQAIRNITTKELLRIITHSAKEERNTEKAIYGHDSFALDVEREDGELFEKATIHPSKRESTLDDDLINIETLPEWARKAFPDIKNLNLIQSRSYNSAFNTSQNMLLSAPTGCGKTNVALLCILQAFREHIELGKKKNKVLYVAPMKALASEITGKFSKVLGPMGLVVSEVTGDVKIARKELFAIDVIVATPEKLDVITRNSTTTGTQSDDSFLSRVSCIIIDEVHLLNDARGAVIETVVARFFRLIEATQVSRRIVAISATIPNWQDIAQFLRVNPEHTYHFGPEYRHIPLEQLYYGVKPHDADSVMLGICFSHIKETLTKGKQCIVFVHTRNDTIGTAMHLIEMIQQDSTNIEMFKPGKDLYKKFNKQIKNSKYEILLNLAEYCLSVHHAGMSRKDRELVENMFKEGLIKILISTSTLAWGVNLPAHCVVIKGTYISALTISRDINYLELTQMLGRAGRPQFDRTGIGIVITEHKNLNNYIRMQTEKVPIESKLHRNLENSLNAEIALGAVSEVSEAITWLQYTFLYVRMQKNPLVYGLKCLTEDSVEEQLCQMIQNAASNLDRARLIRFNTSNGEFSSTDLGRIAARYYVDYETVYNFAICINPELDTENINKLISSEPGQENLERDTVKANIDEKYILETLCECKEYECLLYRSEEMDELAELFKKCVYKPKRGLNHITTKVSLLIEAHINRSIIVTPSLISDMNYIIENTGRLLLSFFEVAMSETVSAPPIGDIIYKWVLMFERQIWDIEARPRSVMFHFCYPYHAMYDMRRIQSSKLPVISQRTAARLVKYKMDTLLELDKQELSDIVKSKGEGLAVYNCLRHVPFPDINVTSRAISSNISKVTISISINIEWSMRWNGEGESFHIWICSESRLISKNKIELKRNECKRTLDILVPIGLRKNILMMKAFSCKWLGIAVDRQLVLRTCSEKPAEYTPIMKLLPVPTFVLGNGTFKYSHRYLNPLQSQMFPHCYYSDENMLVGAPTGSGKTAIAELAMFRLWCVQPLSKVVYIAPLKALSYERLKDWRKKFGSFKNIVELTGDSVTTAREVEESNIIITTPEKWDGISRHWNNRKYVRSIGLLIIDEIHLLGESRGGVLEAIVTRISCISKHIDITPRIVCLSTALANSLEIADWLKVKRSKSFNFSSAVRPVSCNIYIDGFPLKAYCPRMNSMNKPAFATIMKHDITAPVLVFVSSRRQTRTTAQDFVGLLQVRSLKWSSCSPLKEPFIDEHLNEFVEYGIGIHHAGLHDTDRVRIESMFVRGEIKVLIATSTLAWGVNLPAKIVIVKGTEYYDGKVKAYADYSVTDIMQMIGRAGRKLQDREAYAYIYTETHKVDFYKAFLFTPFPAESSFHEHMVETINSEIVSGSICNTEQVLKYMKNTFMYGRLKRNPSYYLGIDLLRGCNEESNHTDIVSCLIQSCLRILEDLGCISLMNNGDFEVASSCEMIKPTLLGVLASQYYVSCRTMKRFLTFVTSSPAVITEMELLRIIANANEFREVPLRHNEDIYNMQLSSKAIMPIMDTEACDPHAKTFLLLQARIFGLPLPVCDYNNDLKSVVDQIPRVIQALIDLIACYRNFKSLQYLLLSYRYIVNGGNAIGKCCTFNSCTDLTVSVMDTRNARKLAVNRISKPGEIYNYDVTDVKEVDIVVAIRDLPMESDVNYLILGNDKSGVLYGFKKVNKHGNYSFRIRIHQLRRHLVMTLIFASCRSSTYEQQKTLILSVH